MYILVNNLCLNYCRNLIIWDTLLPTKRSVVKGTVRYEIFTHIDPEDVISPLPSPPSVPLSLPEYVCHEGGGASVLAYSQLKQRMFSGGRRGEVCIFDIRQNALIQSLPVHTSAVTCMEVNDVDGYIVTGSAEGDIKVSRKSLLRPLARDPPFRSGRLYIYLPRHGGPALPFGKTVFLPLLLLL